MAVELYKDAHHCCVMFTDLVSDETEAVQANQFLSPTAHREAETAKAHRG